MRRGFSKTWLVVFLTIVVVAGGAIAWRKVFRDQFIPKNFGVVETGKLYRSGGLTVSAMRKVVREHHIQTIVDLGAFDNEPDREASMQALAQELGVARHTFRLKGDGTGNPNDYVAALRYMTDSANEPVLVMCSAGAQRTGAAVILYRCLTDKLSIQQAYPESFGYRHDPGEDWKMLAFLADWAQPIELAYQQGGWIDTQPPATELYQVSPPDGVTAGASSDDEQAPQTSSANP